MFCILQIKLVAIPTWPGHSRGFCTPWYSALQRRQIHMTRALSKTLRRKAASHKKVILPHILTPDRIVFKSLVCVLCPSQKEQEVTLGGLLSGPHLSLKWIHLHTHFSSRGLLPLPPAKIVQKNTRPNVLVFCCVKLQILPLSSLKGSVNFKILTTGSQRSQAC